MMSQCFPVKTVFGEKTCSGKVCTGFIMYRKGIFLWSVCLNAWQCLLITKAFCSISWDKKESKCAFMRILYKTLSSTACFTELKFHSTLTSLISLCNPHLFPRDLPIVKGSCICLLQGPQSLVASIQSKALDRTPDYSYKSIEISF